MNRKNTEKRKIEWLEVIPITLIVISSMVVGWFAYNKAYADYKKQHAIRAEIQQILKECEQTQKEWEQRQKEWE
ncbi:MAG: hypothetical protein IIZ78_29525 [Clostridiales bacterium]|nr:hypothetical protein [Clostridiales bacterium]MBQ1575294.1 hypothetical protein [Clostridiales bacterium]